MSPRRASLTMEAMFWLCRPQTLFSKVPVSLAALYVGTLFPVAQLRDIVLVVILVSSYQALLFVVNDTMDASRDRVTAPHMPIPSGILSLKSSVVCAALLGSVFLISQIMLAVDLTGVLLSLSTIPPALITMKLYSATKSAWFSPILASGSAASPTLWVWLLVGRGHFALFAVLFSVAVLHSLHTNLRAQLRDLEGDPRAGNLTLAVRVGAQNVLYWTVAVRIVELLGIVVLGFYSGSTMGMAWIVPAIALFGLALFRDKVVYTGIPRVQQTQLLKPWVYASFMAEIATLGVLQPELAAVVAVVMFVWYQSLRPLYHIRIEMGGLKKAMCSLSAS
jgi:4-hydroxybenzoate polyprenyltransferase